MLSAISFAAYSNASTILKDITNDGLEDRIIISQKENSSDQLLIIEMQDQDHGFNTILKKTIPYGEYSPIFDVKVDSASNLYKDLDDGTSFTLDYKNENTLILETSKDGYMDKYKFYFIYDKHTKEFVLDRAYFINFNKECDYCFNSIYLLKTKKLQNLNLANFDSKKIYEYIYQEYPAFLKRSDLNGHKIKSQEIMQMYAKLMSGSITEVDTCDCEELRYDITCAAEKYYFPDDLTFSNNIAYFFERSGKYSHAVYFLEKIIKEDPTRIVAYYNLGDAYWGLGEKDKAIEAYQKYIELMKQAKKENKIPQKVKDRVGSIERQP